ncbi:hypothetical protein YQ44_14265 [Janthinobacterium sp. 1_2014MBL_MicDiv]|nr:hypothetical protein YQ44_14265 [Janthinobacterium sp. 1_2014MBL_MicDiv]
MRMLYSRVFIILTSGCAASGDHTLDNLVGQNSFTIAERYGTPSNYRLEDELLQLNYGSEAVGCRVMMLVDPAQRVVGSISTGARCAELSGRQTIP